eukprot:171942-Pyramimonas_sp.AAC.1
MPAALLPSHARTPEVLTSRTQPGAMPAALPSFHALTPEASTFGTARRQCWRSCFHSSFAQQRYRPPAEMLAVPPLFCHTIVP